MAERQKLIDSVEKQANIIEAIAICKPKGFNRWCTLPYPRHPDGCPNFGKRSDCPPSAPYFLDLYEPEVFIVYIWFDYGEYLIKRREIHPDWSEKALGNLRHYQGHLRAALKRYISQLSQNESLKEYHPIYNPEAMGVNVHLACKNAGLKLEWPPKNMYRIALLAKPK